MKRILKYFFVIAVISCFAAGKSFAQVMPKSFTEGDPVKFINEMRDFFESYDRKDGKDFIEEFNEKYLLSGKVPEDVLQAMYMNANLMLKRKFRPAPEYYAYFNTIKAIADHDVPGSTFLDWQSCFVTVGNGKLPKPFSEFILMSENLFKDGRFFRTASGEWWTEGGSWKFACDSVAAIRFTNVTLKARQRNDSTKVDGTTGIYYLNTKTFVGREGKVNWLRTGISEDDMHAELKNYSINVPSFNFVADSVTFYDRTHFQSKPLLGKLTERLVPDVQEKTANYPRFESYSSRYQIKSMYPNVDYEGGFSQVGGKFMASGSTVNPAFFIFKRNGKNFLTVKSTNFSITQNKVTSQNASIKFFLDTDSIVHSAIEFKYFIDDDSSRVVLYRSDEGAAQAPYYNSFHKVDMYVQQIVWFTNHPQIIMNTLPGTTQGEAQFPSETYYRQHLYSRLQMTEPVHPLIKIRNFVRDANNGTRTFTTLDLARYWKIGAEQLRPTIMDLSNQGFLYFDPATDMITYKDKCDRYIAARAGKIDYDNLLFESKVAPGGANAKLNLLNY
ncbi:MAG TPA: hypothetical protein VI731_05070, partial [Bacteroidia bacterium]|nr:hypothetical protein [Bacteroidia bacterium]